MTLTPRELPLTDVSSSGSSCACCAPARQSSGSAAVDAPAEEFLVAGMTCSHCVASVTEELRALDGVTAVDVELHAGGTSRVRVAATSPLDPDAVRAAVAEAGYELVR